jgi:hypothetical protein
MPERLLPRLEYGHLSLFQNLLLIFIDQIESLDFGEFSTIIASSLRSRLAFKSGPKGDHG